jgi:multicomponent Na+:H+ antiporter subunit F
MHLSVFYVVILIHLVLVAALVVYTVRCDGMLRRVLALDALAVVFVSALVLVAIHRDEPGYADVALAMAMLGFVQTVATVRFLERRPGPS